MSLPRLSKVVFLLLLIIVPILSFTGCYPLRVEHGSTWVPGTVYGILLQIIVIVIIIVLVLLIIWLFTKSSKEPSIRQNKDPKYLEIAKERYAKGEISKEEFEQIKKDLS